MSFLRLGKDNWARTRPTQEGIIFLILTLFVGFASLNTGNNLLYLTFGMMLSFIVASGIISMINLSRIEVVLKSPSDVFALTPKPIRFSIENKKLFIPSYSLTLELESRRAYISYLPTNRIETVSVQCFFEQRGWSKLPEAVLYTRFPFGFFKKWIKLELGDKQVLVYPKIDKTNISENGYKETQGEKESDRLGSGDDLRSLRNYNEGDNPKLIHWKTTAKTGKLMVKELQDDEAKEVVVEFNPPRNKSELERQISLSASTLLELLDRGFKVQFIAPDKVFHPSQIRRSPRPVLRYLALFGN